MKERLIIEAISLAFVVLNCVVLAVVYYACGFEITVITGIVLLLNQIEFRTLKTYLYLKSMFEKS